MFQTKKVALALLVGGGVIASGAAACAQDTRTVTEPKIPAACVKLQATHVYTGALWDAATEAKEDTAALQAAIDGFAAKCHPGQAIELTMGPKGTNAFLSGPIELKEGITLLVDKGVTLVASRNPADYDVRGPGPAGRSHRKGRARRSLPSARRMSPSWVVA